MSSCSIPPTSCAKAKLHDKVPLSFVTSEPFVGHFGIGGLPGGEKLLKMFLKKEGITAITGVALEEVTGDRIKLTDGTGVPSPASHKDFGQMAAVCMMDADNNGVMILADHMLPPRKAAVMIPGPQVHAMKVGFEKYYLWKSRHGYIRLP